MVQSSRKLNRNFLEVMTQRVIDDIARKVEMIKGKSDAELFSLFCSMCDWGLNVYIESVKKKHPEMTREQILKDYYKKTLPGRCH